VEVKKPNLGRQVAFLGKKVPDTNGTVTFFSLLAHNVTTRTVDFIASIER
jgi:hypothetical protein